MALFCCTYLFIGSSEHTTSRHRLWLRWLRLRSTPHTAPCRDCTVPTNPRTVYPQHPEIHEHQQSQRAPATTCASCRPRPAVANRYTGGHTPDRANSKDLSVAGSPTPTVYLQHQKRYPTSHHQKHYNPAAHHTSVPRLGLSASPMACVCGAYAESPF